MHKLCLCIPLVLFLSSCNKDSQNEIISENINSIPKITYPKIIDEFLMSNFAINNNVTLRSDWNLSSDYGINAHTYNFEANTRSSFSINTEGLDEHLDDFYVSANSSGPIFITEADEFLYAVNRQRLSNEAIDFIKINVNKSVNSIDEGFEIGLGDTNILVGKVPTEYNGRIIANDYIIKFSP